MCGYVDNCGQCTPTRVIARRRSRRGNPYLCRQLRQRTSCHKNGLPRPLRGLAMTDVVVGRRLGFDFLCHCEEAVRRGNLGEVSFNRNFPSIAAKRLPRACGPCNDRCSRWSAPGLRFSLSLPRLLRSLAMTGGGGYGLLQYYSYVTKRPGALQNEKPSIMIQLR